MLLFGVRESLGNFNFSVRCGICWNILTYGYEILTSNMDKPLIFVWVIGNQKSHDVKNYLILCWISATHYFKQNHEDM